RRGPPAQRGPGHRPTRADARGSEEGQEGPPEPAEPAGRRQPAAGGQPGAHQARRATEAAPRPPDPGERADGALRQEAPRGQPASERPGPPERPEEARRAAEDAPGHAPQDRDRGEQVKIRSGSWLFW